MSEVSTLRLYLLRAMYLLLAVGLGITIWPDIISPPNPAADADTVILALLGALALLSIVGIRYPVRMLPLLLFELLWKIIWVIAFALRMWLDTGLDTYASETLFACLMGIVLVPTVIPWRYVSKHYISATGDPWLKKSQQRAV